MKYIKYIFAALVIALSAPTFAQDHGYGHAYHGMHHGKAYAYHGNHHGKGYYHNKAHRERGFERHHDRHGHW